MVDTAILKDLRKICKSGDEEKINKLSLAVDKMLCKDGDPEKKLHHKMFWELKEIVYGKELTKELVEEAIKMLIPFGEVWDIASTEAHMNQRGIKCNLHDFYYAANMLYNAHESLRENEELLCKSAIEWINDGNAISTKTYDYIKHISLYGRK